MGSACSAEPRRNNLHRASSDSDGHFDDHNDRPYTTIRRASSTSGTSAGSRENSGTTCHTTCSEGVCLTITSRGSAKTASNGSGTCDNSASDLLQQRHVELRLNQCSGDESALAFLHLSGQSTYQKQKKKEELKRKKSVDQQHVARSETGSEETIDIDGASDSSVATPANNSRKASVALVSDNNEEGKEVAKAKSDEEEEEVEEEEVSPLVASVSAARLGPLLYRNKLNDPPSPAALPSGATISPKGGDEEDARSRDDHDHRLPTPSVMSGVASASTSPKSSPTSSSPYLPPRGPHTTSSSSPRHHCHFQGLHKKSASKKSLFQIHGSFSVDTNPFLGSDSSVGAVISAAGRRHKRCNNSVSVSYVDDGPHGSNSLSASGRGGCPPPNEPSLTHCPGTESHEGDTTHDHRLTPLSLLGGEDFHPSSPQEFDPLCLSGNKIKRTGASGSAFGSNTSNNSYILGDFNHHASGGAPDNHYSSYYPIGGPVALLKITSGLVGGSSSSSAEHPVVVPFGASANGVTKKGANSSSQEEEVVDSCLHNDGPPGGATMSSKPPPCDANENTATFLSSFATTNSSAPGVSEDKRGSFVSTLESAS